MRRKARTTDASLVGGATLVLCLLSTGTAFAQQWTQRFPAGAPPTPRYTAGNAYDAAHDRLILFSGEDDLSGSIPPRKNNDVWVLQNATGLAGPPSWQPLLAPTRRPDYAGPGSMSVPLARFGGSVTYDSAGNRIIVHGGCWWNCSPALADSWILDNANGLGGTPLWHRLPDAPIGRASHSAVYDPGSGRLIVFGGDTAWFGSMRNDVWVLDTSSGDWSQLLPSSPLPPARSGHTAVYDQASNAMIVFGGGVTWADSSTTYNDVWVLTHANGLGGQPEWIELAPAGAPPGARAGHSAVFDASTRRMTIVGGVLDRRPDAPLPYGDVWALTSADGLDGTPEWIELAPTGGPPPVRWVASVGYSPESDRLVLAMGRHDVPTYQLFNDVWVLEGTRGVRTVTIDIKPRSFPNTVNLGSNGVLPVAILSDPDFDASGIDPMTVSLASAQVRLKGNGSAVSQVEDVNGDQLPDLVVIVTTQALVLTASDTSATLEGRTYDGLAVRGVDSIRVVP